MNNAPEHMREFLYELTEKLDREQFHDFLDRCDEGFNYRVQAYSPDLDKEMTWLDYDYAEMKNLVSMIHQHVRMKGTFARNISMVRVKSQTADSYEVKSRFVVMHTDQDGATKLFATGLYQDQVTVKDQCTRLQNRTVYLDTRDLGPGIHVPI